MTRAKDISKIVTDANLSGTLDVTGDLTVDGSATLQNILNIGGTDPQIRTDTSDGSDNKTLWLGGGGVAYDWNRGGFFYAQGNEAGGHVGITAGAVSGGSIKFTAGTAERMRIDSSGRVMIGTTTEGDASADDLTVAGSANTGITIRAGASNNSSIYMSDDTSGAGEYAGYISYSHSSNSMSFGVSSGQKALIDSSGNVGIGTASPVATSGGIDTASSALSIVMGGNGAGGTGRTNSTNKEARLAAVHYTNSEEPVGVATVFTGSSANDVRFGGGSSIINAATVLSFYTATNNTTTGGTERMRIDSSGKVGIGTSSPNGTLHVYSNNNPLAHFHAIDSADKIGIIMQHNRGLSGFAGKMIQFRRNDGTEVGSVTIGVSTTFYNTSSDHRLKENVTADWDATTRLKQLNPVRFNFIADADTTVDGFLAHEVQSVVPEAITGTHNEVDADGNPIYQGIDQSKLVPLLVKTIQELEARITALENGE